jgi:hypothetical protein
LVACQRWSISRKFPDFPRRFVVLLSNSYPGTLAEETVNAHEGQRRETSGQFAERTRPFV